MRKNNGKDFLTQLIVGMYNTQYQKRINPKDYLIKSIPKSYQSDFGYEVWHKDEVDRLRLRLYFSLRNSQSFAPFRLEVDTQRLVGNLGDEIFVAIGSLPSYLVENQTYQFSWIDDAEEPGEIMYFMSGEPMQFVEGGYIHSVSGG